MNLGKSSDYILSFQVKGIPFLMSDLFARGYDGVNVLDIWKDGMWSEYFPIEACKQYGEAGLILYGDQEKLEEHKQRLEFVQTNCEKYAKSVIQNNTLSQSDLSQLFKAWLEFLQLYFCLGIEYTELAAQQRDNHILSENLERVHELKNPAREYLNQSYINEDSYLAIILKKLEGRFGVTTEQLWQYTLEEILDLFDKKYVDSKMIEARAQAAIIQVKQKHVTYAWGEEALTILKTFEENEAKEITVLSGNVANKHMTVRGQVAIINVDYQDFAGMNAKMAAMPTGAILIAQTTAPELMVAIKKAGAIVTDLGGLMSHAAIVSRELGIPCLVGTRHATQTFKDGDIVEVDTQKGVVRRVS